MYIYTYFNSSTSDHVEASSGLKAASLHPPTAESEIILMDPRLAVGSSAWTA